jgi:DeoR/GlpR family transcriptional regulator of sugar metabolism
VKNNEKRALELINTRKSASVSDICGALNISESTARRILTALSGGNLITRYHGGAQCLAIAGGSGSIQSRKDENRQLKDAIARTAAGRVKQGQTVLLTGGTTVYMMCRYLMDKRITVLTNSLIVFNELTAAPYIDLIMLGGVYNREEMEMEGILTNFGLKMFKADSIFMGTNGFDPGFGFLTDRVEALELYRLCIEASKEKYIVADSSKLGGRGSAVIAACGMVDYLITDAGVGRDVAEKFMQNGVKVIYC